MDVNVILKLVDAGFSKDEIIRLAGAGKEPELPKAEPEPKKAEPEELAKEEPEKAESTEDKVNAAIEKALEPFKALYNNMAKLAAMPSLDNVKPKGVDDIIDSFFKGD